MSDPIARATSPIAQAQSDAVEAAAFRRLVRHLQHRSDVQNVDLMATAGFCRNCLGDWLAEAAEARGVPIGKESARARIYGMSQAVWKSRHQASATAAQLAAMAESLERNAADVELDAALDDSFPASDPPSAAQP